MISATGSFGLCSIRIGLTGVKVKELLALIMQNWLCSW